MKNAKAPVYKIPRNANIAPGKKVLLNWSLLIKQAMRITAAAIEKGTGKLLGVVSTSLLMSMQWVPFEE